MASKHGIQMDKVISSGLSSVKNENGYFKPNGNEGDNKFSVDALMMKQEVIDQVTSQSSLLQNFKTLFFDYALKNGPTQLQ